MRVRFLWVALKGRQAEPTGRGGGALCLRFRGARSAMTELVTSQLVAVGMAGVLLFGNGLLAPWARTHPGKWVGQQRALELCTFRGCTNPGQGMGRDCGPAKIAGGLPRDCQGLPGELSTFRGGQGWISGVRICWLQALQARETPVPNRWPRNRVDLNRNLNQAKGSQLEQPVPQCNEGMNLGLQLH